MVVRFQVPGVPLRPRYPNGHLPRRPLGSSRDPLLGWVRAGVQAGSGWRHWDWTRGHCCHLNRTTNNCNLITHPTSPLQLKMGPCGGGHIIISAFRLACSIIEAYIDHLYSAHIITVPVYTAFNSSRTKENITTRRRSFAFAFECRKALGERIIDTHSLHLNNSAYESIITNIRSLHLNDVSVRMIITTRSFHRMGIELSTANLNLTLILTAEQRYSISLFRNLYSRNIT